MTEQVSSNPLSVAIQCMVLVDSLLRELKFSEDSTMRHNLANAIALVKQSTVEPQPSASNPLSDEQESRAREIILDCRQMPHWAARQIVRLGDRVAELERATVEPAPVAPIVSIYVSDGKIVSGTFYAPSLPDGRHELFPVPVSAQGEWKRFQSSSEPPVVGWQPIETAPHGDVLLLCRRGLDGDWSMHTGYWTDSGRKGWTTGAMWLDQMTHWLPLPEPPSSVSTKSVESP